MRGRGAIVALVAAAALAGCDEAGAIFETARDKGGTKVPEEMRAEPDPAAREALERRIQHQRFQ